MVSPAGVDLSLYSNAALPVRSNTSKRISVRVPQPPHERRVEACRALARISCGPPSVVDPHYGSAWWVRWNMADGSIKSRYGLMVGLRPVAPAGLTSVAPCGAATSLHSRRTGMAER